MSATAGSAPKRDTTVITTVSPDGMPYDSVAPDGMPYDGIGTDGMPYD